LMVVRGLASQSFVTVNNGPKAVAAPKAKYCGTIALGIHRARAPSPSFEWLEWDLESIALFTRRR
jgi:hypothetical protein